MVKDLQNCRDMWRRHTGAVRRDKAAWEKKVLDTYMAKARSGTLSPLLALIGQYLLFAADAEAGRAALLEILFSRIRPCAFGRTTGTSSTIPMV
eukprot:gene7114-biopygen4377